MRGALLRFGVSTGLAHWALAALDTPGAAPPPLGQLAATLRAVPGLPGAAALAARLEAPGAPADLRAALAQALAAFPYGIPRRPDHAP